ncbi:HCP-like protein, partial [Tothia fuscella]
YAKSFFQTLFLSGPPTSGNEKAPINGGPLYQAVQLLQHAADEGNSDALFLLAEMNFHGNYSHPRNYTEAFHRYQQLATLTGNATAQHMVGFMYSTGIGGVVEKDQAKAMLYYTFAAEGGHVRSQMAIAYRHHSGIGTPRNCDEAVHYYQRVADEVIKFLRSGPPGNHMMEKSSYRIVDDHGGIYGEGASVSSSGPNAMTATANSDAHASIDDVLEYLDLMYRKGDLKAALQLAKMYYDGSRKTKRDLALAKQYFLEVARQNWPKGKAKADVSASTEKYASKAAGFLGRMFLRGEGVPQDFDVAQIWFKRGASNGDAVSQYSLGIMYLDGLGVPQDTVKAAEYFGPAADQDLAAAQVRLGALFLDQGDVNTAIKYFDLAARHGHVEAYYYLAELTHQGIGREKSCTMASMYYKIVSEKAESILASFKEANEAYDNGDLETALVNFMLAAEQGFETAQANVAYLLDMTIPRFSLPSLVSTLKIKNPVAATSDLALLYWTRSAKQSNIDSLVKMGDYYLEGHGTKPDREKAAACYQAAAETHQSAQAYWNLGWMYENGIGIEQDFHLAKRFYDHALETNKEAFLPVTLALFKLRARSFWNTITNGNIKSIQDEPAVVRKTWSEWLTAFLEADAAYHAEDHIFENDDWDSLDPMPGGDDSFYADGDIDDGILESLAIIALAGALALLVVYRRRRADERNGNGNANGGANGNVVPGNQAQVQPDGGLFPQPGDPEFPGWAVGGVGH